MEPTLIYTHDFGQVACDLRTSEQFERIPWTKKGKPDRRFEIGKIAAGVWPRWEAAVRKLAAEKYKAGQSLETDDLPSLNDFGWPVSLT